MAVLILTACSAFAQVVPRDPLTVDRTNKRVGTSFKVPTGMSLTMESGSTLTISGTLTLGTVLPVASGGTGVATITGLVVGNGTAAMSGITTSAALAAVMSDETGDGGGYVRAENPSLVTPTIGTSLLMAGSSVIKPTVNGGSKLGDNGQAFSDIYVSDLASLTWGNDALTLQGDITALTLSLYGGDLQLTAQTNAAGSAVTVDATQSLTNKTINGLTLTTSTGTITITNGKTLSLSNTLTLTGTDGSSVAFGAGGTVAYTANKLSAFAATTSAELASVISDETGTGTLALNTSPNLVTPGVQANAFGIATILTTAATTANKTATFPDATGNVVLDSATQTLTNKTISGASNTITNVPLTTGVTGVLPATNGGSGATNTIYKFKATSEVRNSTTAYADDADMQVDVTSGQWIIECRLIMVTQGGGIKLQTTGPAKSQFRESAVWDINGIAVSDISNASLNGYDVVISRNNGTETWFVDLRYAITFTASGPFKFQWAQVASHASDSLMRDGSYIRATKL